MVVGKIENVFENLLIFERKVNARKAGVPSFLMVFTGTEYAFQMGNGVWSYR